VHADVDEGAEGGDVGHDPLRGSCWAAGRQETRCRSWKVAVFEFGTRIAGRAFPIQLECRATVGTPNLSSVNSAGRKPLQRRRLTHHFADAFADTRENALDDRISLRMNRGAVERIVAVVDAQESRGPARRSCRRGAAPCAVFFPIRERAVGISVLDDVFFASTLFSPEMRRASSRPPKLY